MSQPPTVPGLRAAGKIAVELREWIALTEVPRIIGRKLHVNTLHRWVTRGVRGHKLRSVLIGGRRQTKEVWVQEFIAAINGQPVPAVHRAGLDSVCRSFGV